MTNALYPDGARGDVGSKLDYGFRRRSSGPKRWVYGTIDVRPDDIIFIDGTEQPTYSPPPLTDVPDLEVDLAHDQAFLKSLQDDRFAQAVYAVFTNRDFLKGTDDRRWSCGDRQAARLVSDLRGLGESYQDYFLGEFPGVWPDDRPEREALFRKMISTFSTPIKEPTLDETWARIEKMGQHRAKLRPDLPMPTDEELRQQKEKLRLQLEAGRAEFAKRLPEMEAKRKKTLEGYQRALARVGLAENADVFETLRSHLTRLGWRTETAEDRARAARKSLEVRLAVLREIKTLEQRPDGETPEWAPRVSRTGVGVGWTVYVPVFKSDEEREAHFVGERLGELARSGRITQQEYILLKGRLEERPNQR